MRRYSRYSWLRGPSLWPSDSHTRELTGHAEPSLSNGRLALDAVCSQVHILAIRPRPRGRPEVFSEEIKRRDMRLEKLKFVPFLIIGFLGLTGAGFAIASAQQSKRPFTVADDIEVAHFGDPYFEGAAIFRFSPDGSYFAVDTERGRLDLNRVEDSLRFYRSQDVAAFLDRADGKEPPLPVWVVTLSANQGLVITGWRWLEDSSGVTFLERMENNKQRLVLADLQKKKVEALTPATEDVQSFDIR